MPFVARLCLPSPLAAKLSAMSAAAQIETGSALRVKFNDAGLVPAIVQDVETGEVLMMGWMNDAALRQTLATGLATFYSRSRDKMWVKGESSGHTQEVVEVRVDCDQDTLLLRCKSHGPCCHVGYRSCFYRSVEGEGEGDGDSSQLRFVEQKAYDPEAVYGA